MSLSFQSLFKILNDNNYSTIISWDAFGESFYVYDSDKLIPNVLSQISKKITFISFEKKLIKHGFLKMTFDSHTQYIHPYFNKNSKNFKKLTKSDADDYFRLSQFGFKNTINNILVDIYNTKTQIILLRSELSYYDKSIKTIQNQLKKEAKKHHYPNYHQFPLTPILPASDVGSSGLCYVSGVRGVDYVPDTPMNTPTNTPVNTPDIASLKSSPMFGNLCPVNTPNIASLNSSHMFSNFNTPKLEPLFEDVIQEQNLYNDVLCDGLYDELNEFLN